MSSYSLRLLHLSLLIPQISSEAAVDSDVFENLKYSPTTRVIIEFDNTLTQEAIRHHKALGSGDSDRLAERLLQISEASQASALRLLSELHPGREQTDMFHLWLSNKLVIKNADQSIVEQLSKLFNVRRIKTDKQLYQLLQPARSKYDGVQQRLNWFLHYDDWNLKMIRAKDVWKEGVSGAGVVVGIVDTGVNLGHDMLRTKFREYHGWYDSVNDRATPYDDNDHGTTVASFVVSGQIDAGGRSVGVAPGAKFIACKALNLNGSAWHGSIQKCMEFMRCPTDSHGANPDCSAGAKVVNHSFGAIGDYDESYFDIYSDHGIIIVQSAGNKGNCTSLNYQGLLEYPIVVGSVNQSKHLSLFSSMGPPPVELGLYTLVKPDLVAPGDDVIGVEESPRVHNEFSAVTGTSFAAPHVAGVVALMLSANPALKHAHIKKILQDTAIFPVTIRRKLCGYIPTYTKPNHMVGHGLVNAYGAYKAALKVACVSR